MHIYIYIYPRDASEPQAPTAGLRARGAPGMIIPSLIMRLIQIVITIIIIIITTIMIIIITIMIMITIIINTNKFDSNTNE